MPTFEKEQKHERIDYRHKAKLTSKNYQRNTRGKYFLGDTLKRK